jgi:hypothetical protein
LAVGIGGKRGGQVVQGQPLEHHRQVGVGDAPAVEQTGLARAQQAAGHVDELGRGGVRGVGQRLAGGAVEHGFGGTFLAQGGQVAAQPGLQLAGAGARAEVAGIEGGMRGRGEGLVQVFGDGAGFGQVEILVRQRGHPGGQRAGLVGLHALLARFQIDRAHLERQLLFGQRHIGRHGIGTEEQGVDE